MECGESLAAGYAMMILRRNRARRALVVVVVGILAVGGHM